MYRGFLRSVVIHILLCRTTIRDPFIHCDHSLIRGGSISVVKKRIFYYRVSILFYVYLLRCTLVTLEKSALRLKQVCNQCTPPNDSHSEPYIRIAIISLYFLQFAQNLLYKLASRTCFISLRRSRMCL